jgi:hypothetical protein
MHLLLLLIDENPLAPRPKKIAVQWTACIEVEVKVTLLGPVPTG